MHAVTNQVQQSLPRPYLLKQTALVLSSSTRNITLSPTELTFNSEGVMGMQVISATIDDTEFLAKLTKKNDKEDIQFLQDQLDNYSDELSKDFAAGVLAAIAIFKGDKYLEDYLGES